MTTLTAEEARARAAVAQWLSRTARDGMATAKAAILEHMGPGDRVHARIDGIDVATVSVTDPKPRETIAVTDPKAFAEWVQEHHPDAIVPTVADWFSTEGNLKALIAAKGEVPPGVDIIEKVGAPTVQVRLSAEQEANLAALAAHTPVTRYITQAGEE
ncbi:hypothetical protein NSA19_02780 [Actinomyces bowdenii]|uniref:hypothetical protein n=1 Tax=Actinomyces bowdenii TaxID=131109 RepID=UPI00214C0173|nr:hypothetical protein [Actinomyces bowdenii]MCR2051794.1 hypothetical protein [Actinomyces bowdenii]